MLLKFIKSADWDYENVEDWEDSYPECGWSHQSPIDIIPASNCETPLELEWTSEPQHYAIRNSGYSLVAIPFEIDTKGYGDISGLEVLHHTNDTEIRLQNAFYNTYASKINKEYCFDSLHFHWSTDDEDGSEHTINGESYPLEVHLVHYSCDYYTINEALDDYVEGNISAYYDDDHVLAVIGVMFEIGYEPNPVLEHILDDNIINGIRKYHDPEEKFGDFLLQIYYTQFNISGLLPDNTEIYAYAGSLTTPPCYETVRWHVMKETMTVTQEQMDKFRSILSGTRRRDTVAPNYRPVQPLNNRTIYECQEDVDDEEVEKDAL